jgi:hypothetical protein
MSRNSILALGALCWSIAVAFAIGHLMAGDIIGPAVMGIALMLWVALRWHPTAHKAVPAEVASN